MSGPGDVNLPAAQAGVKGAASAGAGKAHRPIEEQYRALLNNYRQLTDRMRDAVLIVQQGLVRYANPAAEDLLGSKELIGSALIGYIAPQHRPSVEAALEKGSDGSII